MPLGDCDHGGERRHQPAIGLTGPLLRPLECVARTFRFTQDDGATINPEPAQMYEALAMEKHVVVRIDPIPEARSHRDNGMSDDNP